MSRLALRLIDAVLFVPATVAVRPRETGMEVGGTGLTDRDVGSGVTLISRGDRGVVSEGFGVGAP